MSKVKSVLSPSEDRPQRIIPEGLESAFINSWGGWDDMEVGAFMFYNADLKDVFDLPTDKLYDVYVDINKMIVEIYGRNEDDTDNTVLATRKMTVTIS